MESKELALICARLADSKKAENIVILDMREVSTITNFFVIATGIADQHVRAIADQVRDEAKRLHEVSTRTIEGAVNAGWIVIDYFDVIVHVMTAESRERFDLEGLWGDAERVESWQAESVKAD